MVMHPKYVRLAPPAAPREEKPAPQERQYLVVGPRLVNGKKAGETVVLALTDEQEKALVEAGHIKPKRKSVENRRPAVSEERERRNHG
ncbi:hypothetical protein GCM10012275_28260 [Longimycelium tulufanense]|uniref:Uncharacterized protein n=1 Tax=Longimycelium tulufanense TaxID=907463 RepID=A0A8J3CEH3_9PSEU|nr:hypothetical protein GCM10012275_28260 [Longimycelium tulufanense]